MLSFGAQFNEVSTGIQNSCSATLFQLCKLRGQPWCRLIYCAREKKTHEPVVPFEETAKTIDSRVEEAVRKRMNRDKPYGIRSDKEGESNEEKKEKKAKQIKEANELEEKVALLKMKNKCKK